MKKSLIFVFIVLLFYCFNISVSANDDKKEYSELIEEQYELLKIDTLNNNLPNGVTDDLQKIGITSSKPSDLQEFSINKFFEYLFSKVVEIMRKPFFSLVGCFAIILICALFDGMKTTMSNTSLNGVLSVITSICICGVIIMPIIECMSNISQVIKAFGNFMLCFIPIFSGVVAVSGGSVSSLGYSTTIFTLAQILSIFIVDILLPAIGIFLALSVTGAFNESINISGIVSSIKKIVIFVLSLLVTIFIGLFTLQNSIAVSTDSIGLKTAKFVSSSFIPIVGGALGDALSSVLSCLLLIKSAVGGFGIMVCIVTLLPPILMVIFFIFTISLIVGFAQILNMSLVANMMIAIKDCFSILFAFLICYGILIMSTTSIMINMSAG